MKPVYFPHPNAISSNEQMVLMHNGHILTGEDGYLWSTTLLASLDHSSIEILWIGHFNEYTCLVCNLQQLPEFLYDAEAVTLRQLLFRTPFDNFTIAGQATQLLNWRHTHRFCGSCGHKTQPHDSERALVCPACQLHFYPRINPCVIVLVTRGPELLLARHARAGSNYFSCLAGFMEVGETPEQTVAREVREEVGIEIENIRYIESQSWPFPSQLMLGFFADYKSGELQIDPEEIAEAAWYQSDSLPTTPALGISVAGRLIELFLRRSSLPEH